MSSFQSPIRVPTIPHIRELSRLAPTRSSDATAKQWQKTNQTTDQARGLTDTARRVTRQIFNIQGRALAPHIMHPFKAYNVPQILCPIKGTYGGQDYDPTKDAWRTFRVRIGNIGVRPKWFLPDDNMVESLYIGNNSEAVLAAVTGSDGNDLQFSTKTGIFAEDYQEDKKDLSNVYATEVKFVLGDGSSTTTTFQSTATFVLNVDTLSLVFTTFCAVWLEIIGDSDSMTPPYPEIRMRMYNDQIVPDNDNPFPDGDNIFPIAILSTSSPAGSEQFLPQFYVSQYEYDHIVNRYLGMNFRGEFNTSLNNQAFYKDDVITIKTPLQMRAGTIDAAPEYAVYFRYDSGDYNSVNVANLYRPMIYVSDTPIIVASVPDFDASGDWRPLAWFFG